MRSAVGLLFLTGCVSASVQQHRDLHPKEREAVVKAMDLMRDAGFTAEAAVVARILEKDNVRAGVMKEPETYEEVYIGFVTLDEWLFIRPDLLNIRPTRELASWLIHAARHALGDDEEECVRAQRRFEHQ